MRSYVQYRDAGIDDQLDGNGPLERVRPGPVRQRDDLFDGVRHVIPSAAGRREGGGDAGGNHTAVMIGGPRPGQFGIVRTGGYENTDATLLPSGDVLVLERHFSLVRGVSMRIRRLTQSSIKPSATVDGDVLVEADLGYQIDNMEGIAVSHLNGETRITVISDNNYRPQYQRTLLLQFALKP